METGPAAELLARLGATGPGVEESLALPTSAPRDAESIPELAGFVWTARRAAAAHDAAHQRENYHDYHESLWDGPPG